MIDLEFLISVSNGDDVFLKMMFNVFLKQTPECIYNLSEGIKAKDFDKIKSSAHKMKSAMGLMGMKETEIYCQTVEEEAKHERIDEIIELVEKINSDCEIAYKEVNEQLEKK